MPTSHLATDYHFKPVSIVDAWKDNNKLWDIYNANSSKHHGTVAN